MIYLDTSTMDHVKLMRLPNELIDHIVQLSTFEPGCDLDCITTVVKSINKHSIPAGLDNIHFSNYLGLPDSEKITILRRLIDYFNYESPFVASRLSFTSDEPLAAYMEHHRVKCRIIHRTQMIRVIRSEKDPHWYISVLFE